MDLTYANTSRHVRTRSANIHVNEAGPADGNVLLLLHGSGPGATGWSNFVNNIPAFAERYRVIAADLPGWGKSDAVSWQDRDHPTSVADLLDALDIEKATLIGNSMGGGTTIRFGYEHPHRVDKLITMGASSGTAGMFGAGGFTEGLKLVQQVYRRPEPEAMRELVNVMTFDSSFATDEIIEERARMTAARPEHNNNYLDGIGKRSIVELDFAKVATITAPTLLFHGRDDRVVHFEHSLKLLTSIADSRLVLVNRCGHWVQIEHTQEFNRTVLAFLTD
ncbi:MAG: alpha/beta hydrolase [Propionibacteriaceae bacterium]|nr:alpha/beta hydrolase [Propionibacteriaceae bacterium]